MPLLIVPTPIGNLGDMTLRGIRALEEADIVACEDTRRTINLLNHLRIKKTLISYHQHNERSRSEAILRKLAEGLAVALVSDAGTPGISDPGYVVIAAAIEAGFQVDVLPGANAPLPALLLSGLPPCPFLFIGFLHDNRRQKAEQLRRAAAVEATLVIYLPPHGLAKELAVICEAMGNRRAALVREISKIYQEAVRGTLAELAAIAETRKIAGEIVLVVEGKSEGNDDRTEELDWQAVAAARKKEGVFDKEIANELFTSYGIPRNAVKAFLLQEVTEDGDEG